MANFAEMKRWLAILLPLSMLGQVPSPGTEPVSPLPETDVLDPATREQRDAEEAARDEAETLDAPEGTPSLLPPRSQTEADAAALGAEPGFGGAGAPTEETATTETPPPETEGAPAPQQEALGAQPLPPPEQATPEQNARQLLELQAQVEALQQQLQAREEQLAQTTERTESLQQDMTALGSNAQELERLRQQRLALIQSVWQWLLAADTALEQGELDVTQALEQADLRVGDVIENASTTGQNETVANMLEVRRLIGVAQGAVANRDIYTARLALQDTSPHLDQARALALSESDVANAVPPPTEAPAASPEAGP